MRIKKRVKRHRRVEEMSDLATVWLGKSWGCSADIGTVNYFPN